MTDFEELLSGEPPDAFEQIELVRYFGDFKNRIKDIKMILKKLKRKKIEHDPKILEFFIDHLEKNETKYYRMLIELIQSDDEDDKLYFREELTFLVQNKWFVMQEAVKWDVETQHAHKKKNK